MLKIPSLLVICIGLANCRRHHQRYDFARNETHFTHKSDVAEVPSPDPSGIWVNKAVGFHRMDDFKIKETHPYKNNAVNLFIEDLKAICSPDSQDTLCTDQPKLPAWADFNEDWRVIKNVIIGGFMPKLEFISPEALKYTFKQLEYVKLTEVENIKVYTLPRTAAPGNHLIIRNPSLEEIKEVENPSYGLKFFLYDDIKRPHGDEEQVYHSRITIHPLSVDTTLEDFTVKTNADEVNLHLPKIPSEFTLKEITFVYKGRNTDQISINFSGIQGKVGTMVYRFETIPWSITHLLPPHDFQDKIETIRFIINNQATTLEESQVIQDTEDKYKFVVDFQDRAELKKLSQKKPRITKEDSTIKHDYVLVDLKTISRNADDAFDYIVRTYYLIVDEKIVDSVTTAKSVKVMYEKLIYIDFGAVFSFGKMTYERKENVVTELWDPFTLEFVYQVIIETLKIIQPNMFSTTRSLLVVKKNLAIDILTRLKQHNLQKRITELTQINRHYLDSILIKVNEFILFASRQDSIVAKLPRLSQSLYREKTIVYQDMARLLVQTKQFQEVKSGQKILLDVARIKTESQQAIAIEQGKQLEKKRIEGLKTLHKLTNQRKVFQYQVEQGATAFEAAVERRQMQAYFDVAMGVFSAIAGLFTGSVEGIAKIGEVTSKLVKLVASLKKIARMIQRIGKLIEVLGGTMQSFMDTYNNVNVAQEGFDPGFEMVKQDEINWDEFDKQTQDFSDKTMGNVVEQVSSLGADEILEWDIAKAQVEGMMDASLSMEIPETLSYKTSILKMIAAGKANMEAAIDFAELKADIYMNQFQVYTYNKEIEKINNAGSKMSDEHGEMEDFNKNLDLSEKQLKVDLFLHAIDYCDAQFYFTLSSCFIFREFSFDSTLSQMMHMSSKMLVDSFDKINDLYPPPQTFVKKSIKFVQPTHCEELLMKMKSTMRDFCRDITSNECKQAIKDAVLVGAPASEDEQETIIWTKTRLYMNCFSSPIQQLREWRSTEITITLDHPEFQGFDRVRLDEIQVKLDGVATTDGYLSVIISNTGVFEDRLRNKISVFTGDEWKRMFRYKISEDDPDKSKQILADVHSEFEKSFNKPTPFTSWVITLPKKYNKGIDLSNIKSIELILSGTLMVQDGADEKEELMIVNPNAFVSGD